MSQPLPSRRARGRRAPLADINVTPLVDVMLVLLIIFMVTAPLLTAGVKVDLPQAGTRALDQDREPVQLSLDAQGQLYVGDEPVGGAPLSDVMARLAARGTGDKAPQILLRADRTLDYGRVMAVMTALSDAGLTHVALVTAPVQAPAAP